MDEADKLNKKWKNQRRVMLLTNGAILNLTPHKYKLMRRIELPKISKPMQFLFLLSFVAFERVAKHQVPCVFAIPLACLFLIVPLLG